MARAVAPSMIRRFLDRRDLTFKTNRARQRADAARRRDSTRSLVRGAT
jgi:hypothetical protein